MSCGDGSHCNAIEAAEIVGPLLRAPVRGASETVESPILVESPAQATNNRSIFASQAPRTETVVTPHPDATSPMLHPLAPAIAMAQAAEQRMQSIADYRCTLVKREHVGGKLRAPETFVLKVRQQPMSMYVQCLGPAQPRGREILFVEGRNNGLALVHTLGSRVRLAANQSVDLKSSRLLAESRHAMADYGLERFVADLLTEYEHESQFGESDVLVEENARVEDRACVAIQVTHPQPRNSFKYHRTIVYFDRQMELPIRFEAYTWPTRAGATPALVEERVYRKLTVDTGLTDVDFDARNPVYKFR
ncbi:MAG TPA: DUF1571 domain-containing protein [Pirellulales bacterium]|nr:DUF1571 domain-containing protein [Pirellulales bacterium]